MSNKRPFRARLEFGAGPIWRCAILLLIACSAHACGDTRSGDTPGAAGSTMASTQCYEWTNGGRYRVPGPVRSGVSRVNVALHPSGRYEAVTSYGFMKGLGESGTWSASDGRVWFHPETGSEDAPWRSRHSVAWQPGVSIEWVVGEEVDDIHGAGVRTWREVKVGIVVATAAACPSVLEYIGSGADKVPR